MEVTMPTVLVIEDEDYIRSLMREMLTPNGYEVREAENGVEGVKMYKQNPASVVLLDMFMPEKDGLETLRDLLRIDPRVRVVAMSGGGKHSHVQILKPASLMGAIHVLLKPFTRDDLLAALCRALAVPREHPPQPSRNLSAQSDGPAAFWR
jgi:two-component system, chemotaxis family, chemotaxis protein CheY